MFKYNINDLVKFKNSTDVIFEGIISTQILHVMKDEIIKYYSINVYNEIYKVLENDIISKVEGITLYDIKFKFNIDDIVYIKSKNNYINGSIVYKMIEGFNDDTYECSYMIKTSENNFDIYNEKELLPEKEYKNLIFKKGDK